MRPAFAVSAAIVGTAVSCTAISGVSDLRVCTEPQCSNAGDAAKPGDEAAAPPMFVTIGGTVSNLLGKGLVLKNGPDDLPIATDGPFTFPTKVRQGDPYAVIVGLQPVEPSQICSMTDGSGTAPGSDVTNVSVTCSPALYNVGGVVIGSASGAVLTNNNVDDLAIFSNSVFTFPTKVLSGLPFNVAIKTQATTGGPCDVSGATGTMGVADVTSVVVNCTPGTFTVGGTVTGIIGTVVVQESGTGDTALTSNGTFAIRKTLPPSSPYTVTILTQPDYPPRSETCTVTNGSGHLGMANVTSVAISCTTNSFTVGGSLTALRGPSVVLQNNGGDDLTLSANGPFTFATSELSGSTYAVTVRTMPPGEKCAVTTGSGTLTKANVTDVAVQCGLDPGIKCATDVYCSGDQFCCFNRSAGSGACLSNGASCSGEVVSCDDAGECGDAGGVCCARYARGNGSLREASCRASAAACAQSAGNDLTELFCDPNAPSPCPAGMACTGVAKVGGYAKCL